MGIRDRIAALGHRAASTISDLSDRVAPGAQSQTSTPPQPQPQPQSQTFEESAFAFDAQELTRAMREAVHTGYFHEQGPLASGGGQLIDMDIGPGRYSSYDNSAIELEKARSSGALTPGSAPVVRPDGSISVPTDSGASPRALYQDPFALVQQLGFRDKPSALTYATLSSMVWRVPIVQAILQTRINQISAFATPQRSRFETGFRVKMRDPEAKPTPADKKFMAAAEDMIVRTGVRTNDQRIRDNFEMFLRKIVRDSLTYDQVNVEVIMGRDGRPAEWYAVDASTIRLADTARLTPLDDENAIRTVQIYDNVIIGEFSAKEMAFEVRNPRTDLRSYGYGTSELEMVVSTITAILWAWHYNQNFFSQGSVAKGLLNLVGAIPEKQLRAFRRNWYQMVSGVDNAWRTPITNAEKVEWINMHTSNRDMEFSAWMDFLIKVVCSVYAMDPIEINFKYGTSAQRSMFEGAQRAKAQESRERGLKPLLRFLGRIIDKYILWPINPDFTIEFVGLESQTPKEMADLMTQRVRTIYTLNEIRAENDLEPLPDGLGDIILDANWMNARNQVIQQKQAEEQQRQQQALAAQQSSVSGVADLESMLAQLEGKTGGDGGSSGDKPEASTRAPAGKPQSTPAQTPKEIETELQGEGTTPIELSMTSSVDKSPELQKSVKLEFTI